MLVILKRNQPQVNPNLFFRRRLVLIRKFVDIFIDDVLIFLHFSTMSRNCLVLMSSDPTSSKKESLRIYVDVESLSLETYHLDHLVDSITVLIRPVFLEKVISMSFGRCLETPFPNRESIDAFKWYYGKQILQILKVKNVVTIFIPCWSCMN